MPKENKSGFPEHGEEYNENNQQDDDNNQNDDNNPGGENENNDENEPQFATREELQKFQQKQDQIFSMLQSLTKPPAGGQQPQQETQQQSAPKKGQIAGMSAEEFEALFWDSPAQALDRYKQSIVQEVRGEQAKVSSQQQFWNDFYVEHQDLREDDDLVKLTLNANIGTLADMPVKEASAKLADLTRQRILKYSGGEKRGGNENGKTRVFTEGGQHRMPPKKQEQPEAPKTLGELIKARKAARRGGGKAMAS